MKKCLLIIAVLLQLGAYAQLTSYDLSTVPEVVKKDADVVKRYEDIVFEVTDIDKASMKVHRFLTVKDEKGKRDLNFRVYTSKIASLDDASITVYDAAGRQVSRYKKKDMRTLANGEGLIDDGYVTFFNVPVPSYPVTVEYEYEMKLKETLGFPPYRILTPGEGIEKSSFTVKVPKEVGLRFKERNIHLTPQVTEEGQYNIYKWSVSNMPPIEDEEGAVNYRSRYPSIEMAPNHFSYYGYQGDFTSWKSYGEWMAKLYKGLDELPEERKAFFRDLVKNAGSEKEKVRIIYNYLQKNFRYVSIQLGIGGLKPFSADFTDKKKYGDCKALSNFMKAALKAVGITSYVAIINSQYNSEPVDKDFPSDDLFDHVILCVPQPKDSIWLECTSSTIDFGILSTFTENRNALLITDNGGVLVPTPVSRPDENKNFVTTTVQLTSEGSGHSNTIFSLAGDYKEEMNAMLSGKKDDQKEYLVNELGFKQPNEFELVKKDSGDLFITTLNMEVEKVPEFIAGSKMFVAPRMYKFWPHKLPRAANRKLDFYFQSPFEKTDTTIFKLPAGASVDALPKPKDLSCAYATYTTKYWYNETEKAIYSTASLVLKKHKIPAAAYADVKNFFDEVMMDDSQRIVVKKE
jgi:hypothetical protein